MFLWGSGESRLGHSDLPRRRLISDLSFSSESVNSFRRRLQFALEGRHDAGFQF